MPHHVGVSVVDPLRICFVCTGNICRSPTAEIVLNAMAVKRGLDDRVVADSAGTGDWHIGERADRRALQTLAAAGYDGELHRARQFDDEWFASVDLVVALDRGHARTLRAWAPTPQARAKVVLLRSFDPQLAPLLAGDRLDSEIGALDVPDPYYAGQDAFTLVLEQVERACAGLLDHVEQLLAERSQG